jgi:sulfate adenylyltransferase subunit 2
MDQLRYSKFLKEQENESIYLIREVAAQFERPVLLFSGGKDSIVMGHLARKACFPGPIPFPFLHIDTGHNFTETIEFRDRYIRKLGAKIIIRTVQESIDKGRVREEKGPNASRNALQTITLLDAIQEFGFDVAMGGARRDEEKSRAKERFFSYRDMFGQWDPKNQRPELWNLFNGMRNKGEHFRAFPLSNWTELDVWQYIKMENLEIPGLYLAHEREVLQRDGMFLANSDYISLLPGEKVKKKKIRFRTIGDMTCTGAFESGAESINDIITEISTVRITERGTRADDKRSDAAMEDRKRQGYF